VQGKKRMLVNIFVGWFVLNVSTKSFGPKREKLKKHFALVTKKEAVSHLDGGKQDGEA
jgi:hypothetical protein